MSESHFPPNSARTKPFIYILLCLLSPFITIVSLAAAAVTLICLVMFVYVTLLVCICCGKLGRRRSESIPCTLHRARSMRCHLGSVSSASQTRNYGSTSTRISARLSPNQFAPISTLTLFWRYRKVSVWGVRLLRLLFKGVVFGAVFFLLRGTYVILEAGICH